MLRQLNDEDLRSTLDRAREIALLNGGPELPSEALEHYAHAAEELGIPRDAMLQALRERMPLDWSPEVGDLVFAPSVDGTLYVARVLSSPGDTVKVEILEGGDHSCLSHQVRPLELLPGRRLEGKVKDWGWYGVKVQSYNRERQEVRVTHDDWTAVEETLPLTKLRVPLEKPKSQREVMAHHARMLLIRGAAIGVALGGILGYAIAQFVR